MSTPSSPSSTTITTNTTTTSSSSSSSSSSISISTTSTATICACVNCDQPGIYRCSRCKQVHFCSQAHQKAFWPQHKHHCRKPRSPSPASSSSPSGTKASSLPFPKKGVRLAVFRNIIEKYKDEIFDCYIDHYDKSKGMCKKKFEELTTTDVCELIIKPSTDASQLSWCEQYNNSVDIGDASVFVSHAWKYKFSDSVAALENYFARNQMKDSNGEDIYIWFDLFSNNQHVAVVLDFIWWCNTFQSAIKKFGHTIIILSPWDNPIPFTRAWCLFEIYCTVKNGAKLDIAMSDNERKSFFSCMHNDASGTYNQMLGNINLLKSECWNPEDQRRIFEAVESMDGGIALLNQTVLGAMRTTVTSLLENQSSGSSSSQEDELDKKRSLGIVLLSQGKNNEALVLFKECLKGYQSFQGGDHSYVATTYGNMASVYKNQGKYDEALVYQEKCLKFQLAKLAWK